MKAKLSAASKGMRVSGQPEYVEVPKQAILKAMPKITASTDKVAPVKYKGGVIYTSARDRLFRAIRRRGDNYPETRSSFKVNSQRAAWNACVDAIDEEYTPRGSTKRKR